MNWVAITADDFVDEGFTPTERTAVSDAAGADKVQDVLDSAIAEWRGVIDAGGFDVDAATNKIPPSCRRHIIAQARWQLLMKLSALKQLQTEERRRTADSAEEVLRDIAAGERSIEDPDETATDTPHGGTWKSKKKIKMRLDT